MAVNSRTTHFDLITVRLADSNSGNPDGDEIGHQVQVRDKYDVDGTLKCAHADPLEINWARGISQSTAALSIVDLLPASEFTAILAGLAQDWNGNTAAALGWWWLSDSIVTDFSALIDAEHAARGL